MYFGNPYSYIIVAPRLVEQGQDYTPRSVYGVYQDPNAADHHYDNVPYYLNNNGKCQVRVATELQSCGWNRPPPQKSSVKFEHCAHSIMPFTLPIACIQIRLCSTFANDKRRSTEKPERGSAFLHQTR